MAYKIKNKETRENFKYLKDWAKFGVLERSTNFEKSMKEFNRRSRQIREVLAEKDNAKSKFDVMREERRKGYVE